MSDFYTYAYLREDGTPYYIGKGRGRRIKIRGGRCISPPDDPSRIIFLKQNLTEQEAFRHEIYMIFVFGRKNLGTGILRNLTNGGDGFTGGRHSEEFIIAFKNRITGKPKTQKQIDATRESNRNRVITDHMREKMRNSRKNKTWWVNKEGETTLHEGCPGAGWRPGRNWK